MKSCKELQAEIFELQDELRQLEREESRGIDAIRFEISHLRKVRSHRRELLVEHNKLMSELLGCKPGRLQATKTGHSLMKYLFSTRHLISREAPRGVNY